MGKEVSFPMAAEPQEHRPTLYFTLFLYATAGLAGAAIMILEILGTKILAPYMGTSHYVWTAQISVTMCSLAFGYYYGGRLVDRAVPLSRLYGFILGSALYLWLSHPLSPWLAQHLSILRLPLASLLCSALLFGAPLTILAMVCPFFLRHLALSMSSVGRTTGRLSAISTLGSLGGTILIGYFLQPYCSNSMLINGLAGLLAAVALIYLAVWRSKESRA